MRKLMEHAGKQREVNKGFQGRTGEEGMWETSGMNGREQWCTKEFFRGGDKQIQLRTEGREDGDLGAVAPSQGFRSICKWVKPLFLSGCYGCIFHGTGNSAKLFQNFWISGDNPPVRHWQRTRWTVSMMKPVGVQDGDDQPVQDSWCLEVTV
jgi:hypothetical protein